MVTASGSRKRRGFIVQSSITQLGSEVKNPQPSPRLTAPLSGSKIRTSVLSCSQTRVWPLHVSHWAKGTPGRRSRWVWLVPAEGLRGFDRQPSGVHLPTGKTGGNQCRLAVGQDAASGSCRRGTRPRGCGKARATCTRSWPAVPNSCKRSASAPAGACRKGDSNPTARPTRRAPTRGTAPEQESADCSNS